MKKDVLGLLISAFGLIISLVPTLIYINFADSPAFYFLNEQVLPSIPLILFMAIVGVPITIVGVTIFRRGIREMMEELSESTAGAIEGGRLSANKSVEVAVKRSAEVSGTNFERPPTKSDTPNRSKYLIVSSGTELICQNCSSAMPLGARVCSRCRSPFPIAEDEEEACPVCRCYLTDAKRLGDEIIVCNFCFSELRLQGNTLKGLSL
ncbi:MAG: hypothetical protein NZ920_01700 [Aigarchaeota archaeon]|nr:hypothetical protein [Aigarchaeota archaeon]MDW8093157.1 hypothetical protein [Nitrososphaerota archaeon]